MVLKNLEIRQDIQQSGLKQWKVAERFGIHEGNFSRMLRKELDATTKARIFAIIEELKREAS